MKKIYNPSDHDKDTKKSIYLLKNKQKFIADLSEISDSIPLPNDLFRYNLFDTINSDVYEYFIRESILMIRNSMDLYEIGYFDAAYCYLRESIEMSTAMIYIAKLPSDQKMENALGTWMGGEGNLSMRKKVLKSINENQEYLKDFYDKMSRYFISIEVNPRSKNVEVRDNDRINNQVHLQGLDKLNVIKNTSGLSQETINKLNDDFETNVIDCISVVALMRLALDPYAIMLNDEEIFNRTGKILIDAYSDRFISEYIGENTIELYKKTKIYQNYYYSIMSRDKMLPSISAIVKDHYIDMTKYSEIATQTDLLQVEALLVIAIRLNNSKANDFYFNNNMFGFHTNDSNNPKFEFMSFQKYLEEENISNPFNQKFDGILISRFQFFDRPMFIEHIDEFSLEEIHNITREINFIIEVDKGR